MLPQKNFGFQLLIALQRQGLGKTDYDSHTAACTLCGAFGIVCLMISDQPTRIPIAHERARVHVFAILGSNFGHQLPDLPDRLQYPYILMMCLSPCLLFKLLVHITCFVSDKITLEEGYVN